MKDIILEDLKISQELEDLGFKRESRLDFRDDGNYFRMYSYKGIPISVLKDRHGEETLYLCVRDDYCGFMKTGCRNKKRAVRNTPFDWWFDYSQIKKVTVTNVFTDETFEDNLVAIGEKYNGKGNNFSVGFVMGICETYLKEFTIAEEEYKKDIQQKRQECEEKIKKAIQQGSEELEWFLGETRGAFLQVSKHCYPRTTEAFEEYWDYLNKKQKEWTQQSQKLSDTQLYSWYKELKGSWKINLDENFYVKEIRSILKDS